MTTSKTDHRFRKRYVLRNIILIVPPLVAFVLVWLDRGNFSFTSWLAIAFFLAWIQTFSLPLGGRGQAIRGNSATSVFILLVPSPALVADGFSHRSFRQVAWGMAHIVDAQTRTRADAISSS